MHINKELATLNMEKMVRLREFEQCRFDRFKGTDPRRYVKLHGFKLRMTYIRWLFYRAWQWWQKRDIQEPVQPLHGNASGDKPGLHCSKCGVFRWWDHGLPKGAMLPPCPICGNTQVAEDEPVSSTYKGAVYVNLGYAQQVDVREQIYVGKYKLVDPYAAPQSSTDSEGKLRKTAETVDFDVCPECGKHDCPSSKYVNCNGDETDNDTNDAVSQREDREEE